MYQKFYPSLAGNHSAFTALTFMPATWNNEVLGTKN